MLRFIARAAAALGVVVFYRWLLRLATPKQDWWHVVEGWRHVSKWITRGPSMVRMWLLAQIGYTETAWQRLRSRYRSGAFGELGN